MLSVFPHFKKYSAKETLLFIDKVREFEPRSHFSPAYIPSFYNTDGNLKFSTLNGNLLASYTEPETKQSKIVVFGKNKIDSTLREIFLYQKDKELEQVVTDLEASQIENIKDKSIKVIRYPENDEYIISTKEHSYLFGKDLAEERKAVRSFIRNYGDDIKIYELDLSKHNSVALIINALHVWGREIKNNNNDPESLERQYISLFLMHADELPTRNMIISHAGQVIGIILYDVFEEYFCAIGHSLKVDYAYDHAFDFGLHALTSRLHAEGIKFLNVEEDLGIPGLREKKNHLMPVKKLLFYSARPTS